MSLWLWLTLAPAAAIDINDHLILELQGGERIEGWFLKAQQDAVVISVPSTGSSAMVSLNILKSVTLNDAPTPLSVFQAEVDREWSKFLAWKADPPPHPVPGLVATSGLLVAGSGHAMLGEWAVATPMIVADTAFMTTMAVEVSGIGTGRVDLLFTAALLSTIFKSYAIADGYRRAKRRRGRLGLGISSNEKSPS